MTTLEIRDAAIAGSQKMLEWMEENDKGHEEVAVTQIKRKKNAKVYSLKISKRLFSLEAIFFKLRFLPDQELDSGNVKVLEYDRDKALLIVRPKDAYQDAFANATAADILVISDLRFLVERTREWYTENGANLKLPTALSCVESPFTPEEECFPELMPNAQQQAAIRSIFTEPFTYVWGAPGTGKTQFVLAYAALRYVRAGTSIAGGDEDDGAGEPK